MKRYILRLENFGALLFDRTNRQIKSLAVDEVLAFRATETDYDYVSLPNVGYSSLSAPTKVYLGITNKCNLRCLHCSIDADKKDEELSLSLIRDVAQQLKDLGVFIIGLNGAEPLCHKDFFSIAELLKDHGFMVALNTNGLFANSLQDMAASRIDLIKISVDGLEQNHDSIRGPGVFKKVIANIEYLRARDFNVGINFTVSKRNQGDIFDMIKLAQSLQCALKIAPMQSTGRAKLLNDELLDLDDRRNIFKQVTEKYEINSHNSFIQMTENFVVTDCLDISRQFNYQFTRCGNSRVHMSIHTDGKVYSTGRQLDFESLASVCDIRLDRISDIWRVIKDTNEANTKAESKCSHCDIDQLLFQSFKNLIML